MHAPISIHSNDALGGSASSSVGKLGFMNLPLETQKEIVKQVSQRKDLISLQRVSRHFHRLASAKLYNNLGFILTHADSPTYYSTSYTRLADALHILATSEHDYGSYVKSFTLILSERDTEDVQRRILAKYHWEEEATKLLNTALLLMLRKTRTLETFGWDTAIELSGYVYDALAKIDTLHELVIRLDTRAIPRIASFTYPGPPSGVMSTMPPPPPAQFGQAAQASYSTAFSNSSGTTVARHQKANPNISWHGKRKFSCFKDLRNLHILGIDNLDCLPEIATCMTGCSATLKHLNLSLSLDLARRARKPSTPSPPANPAIDPLDDEDDDDMTPPPEPAPIVNPAPVNEADIKKEKAIQDSILAKVFGLEPAKVEDKKVDRSLKATAASLRTKEDADEMFLEEMKKTMTKLIQAKSTGYKGLLNDKNILKQMEKGIEKYLQSNGQKSKKVKASTATGASKHLAPPPHHILSSHTSHPSSQLSQTEWKFAYQAFQDLLGGEQPTPGEFESFMLANGNTLAGLPHSSTFPPAWSYYTEKLPKTGFLGSASNTSSSAGNQMVPAYMPQHPNHHHINQTSNIGHQQLYHPNASAALSSLMNMTKAPPALVEQFKQDLYHKAMQDEEDEMLEDMLIESGKKPPPQPNLDSDSDDSEPDGDPGAINNVGDEGVSGSKGPLFPAVQPNAQEKEDDMDVDMEHPDILDTDSDGDQEMGVDDHSTTDATSNAAPSVAVQPNPSPILDPQLSTVSPKHVLKPPIGKKVKRVHKKSKTADETMQEYIRTKHGFHIESLMLYLIPLKPSVIGRALDLSCLRHLTLLNVGQQGGFWSFVDKVQRESIPIQLRHIHTDDVSMAFLNCVANISGLQDLFMMRRGAKDNDFTPAGAPASLANIRLLVLRKHVTTLRRLVIMNNEDESWDLDAKTLRLLTAKAGALMELAFSVNVSDYHVLMQGFRGLGSLVAMHIINIRTADQCQSISRESRKFTIDNITHCPELKIKYLAMSGLVFELARRPKPWKAKKPSADAKGKGKAKSEEISTDSDNFSEIEGEGLEMACVKHLKFAEVPTVKIFRKEIRSGKL